MFGSIFAVSWILFNNGKTILCLHFVYFRIFKQNEISWISWNFVWNFKLSLIFDSILICKHFPIWGEINYFEFSSECVELVHFQQIEKFQKFPINLTLSTRRNNKILCFLLFRSLFIKTFEIVAYSLYEIWIYFHIEKYVTRTRQERQ